MSNEQIIMYGNKWCPDCRRARQVFARLNTPYEYVDVEADPDARKKVLEINHGYCSVPTIQFPDGSTLTEPDSYTLETKVKSIFPAI